MKHILKAWGVVFVLLMGFGGPLLALAPGDQVLARCNLFSDPYYYPATVASLEDGVVSLAFENGTVGSITEAAVLTRKLTAGDFVFWGNNAAVVTGIKDGTKISIRLLDLVDVSGEATLDQLKLLLRSGPGLEEKTIDQETTIGKQVYAKWEDQIWYSGIVDQTQGEALHVEFSDGNDRWLSPAWVRPFRVKTGDRVYVVNPIDQQPFPAVVKSVDGATVGIRFFDGTTETASEASLMAYLDRPWIDETIGCPCGAKEPEKNASAQELGKLLTPHLHYYDSSSSLENVSISPENIEVGLVLFSPADRPPPANWKQKLSVLAEQVEAFLKRELSPWANIRVFVSAKSVRSRRDLEWYRQNLNESQAWHDWQPTGACLLRAFPDGPRAGFHRVVVVIPDAPGMCEDDSGFENGMGFVRMKGDSFAGVTEEGLAQVTSGVPETTFKEWREDFMASTMAHEIIHTIGVPHSDGDPFEIMNLGPWYPITRPEVHLAEIHKIILRSPFQQSLSLSQGFAGYLLDPHGRYWKTIGWTSNADPDLRLRLARGPGFFRLKETLESFAPGSNSRQPDRLYAGERELCRAYLTAFIAFVHEKYGVSGISGLFLTPEEDAASFVASTLKTSIPDLEKRWQEWMTARISGVKVAKPGK
ncbi:MAG: hypothetical protein WA705_02275 [Candidatus Ozemobacteraceae bacterium]